MSGPPVAAADLVDGLWADVEEEVVRKVMSRYLGGEVRNFDAALEALTGLRSEDLRALAAAKLLSSSVDGVLDAVENMLGAIPPRSYRPLEERSGELRGSLAWSATIAARIARSDPTIVVGRTNIRRPDHELLGSIMRALQFVRQLSQLVGARSPMMSIPTVERAVALSRHRSFRGLRVVWSEAAVGRSSGGPLVATFVRRGRKILDSSRQTLLDETRQLLLTPGEAHRSFELLVGDDIVEHLMAKGWVELRPSLVVQGRRVVRKLSRGTGEVAVLHYQRPLTSVLCVAAGIYRTTLVRSGLSASDLVPDWVLDLRTCEGRTVVVVECKHTVKASSADDRRGLAEMMAYMADVGAVDFRLTGLVVGWNSVALGGSGSMRMTSRCQLGASLDECMSV